MKGQPPLTAQQQRALPATQWSAGLAKSLRQSPVLHKSNGPGLAWEIRETPSCVWIILKVSGSFRLGFRAVFCPTGLQKVRLGKTAGGEFELTACGGLGHYHVRGTFLEGTPPMIRLTTVLTPEEPVRITAAPRDLCLLDGRLEPYRGDGRLYTCQTGNTAAQAFFSAFGNSGMTVFYFQNLSGLADYFRRTGAVPGGCVDGEWPEAGFRLPCGETPLKAAEPVTIADAFVAVTDGKCRRDVDAALLFLDSLARIYPLLPAPGWEFCDWPELAKATLRSLTGSRRCTRVIDGKRYMEAYVGSSYKPPESMVQGAILVPLLEYAEWQKRKIPLVEDLRHVPESFYDPKLKIPLRWLDGAKFTREERSEEEKRYRMDSWYLLHTLVNAGRMAELGMENARKVFFKSLPSLMRIARHFGYDWPVFYDQRNLKVFKAQTEEGQGGERDASGLYIHIMLQAWVLTHKPEYLKEAEAATAKMEELAFGVLYQTNNTILGAVALARLWRATGKTTYKELSLIFIASTFSHLWLWTLGRETRTCMALPPLHNAPYVALYEEAEILSRLQAWQGEMREAVPDSCALLIAEYQKHLLARGKYYFPSELPEDMVTANPKEGGLSRRLAIPLEGLGGPGEQAGTVGQAVYAAAAPFILAAACWHRAAGIPFILFCSYPVFDLEHSGDRYAGELKFRTGGISRLSCQLRIIPVGGNTGKLEFSLDGKKLLREKRPKGRGEAMAEVQGGGPVSITWR